MGIVETSGFHKGLKIMIDDGIWEIMEYAHSKMAQRRPVMKTKLRNIMTGAVQDMTFSTGETFTTPDVTKRPMQFLYSDDISYHFMDTQTYEQYPLGADILGDARLYIKEQQEVIVSLLDDKPIDIELPTVVELEVIETDPGHKGDTVTGGTKRAKLETGAVVNVPLFVVTGEVVRIDSRNGKYVERVKKK